MTTAYRSKLWLEKNGWKAEVVEHRRGRFRYDLFGAFDVMAIRKYPDGRGEVLLVQAFEDRDAKKHRHWWDKDIVKMFQSAPITVATMSWKKVGGRWNKPRIAGLLGNENSLSPLP